MKSLITLLIAVSLTGCANQQFMKNFGEGFAAQSQSRVQPVQPVQYQNIKSQVTDNQCFSACTQAGYQFGLCKSKCTY